jgi:SAM-dependent methyltransferase
MKPCPLCGHPKPHYERTLNQIDLVRCVSCSFVYVDLSVDEIFKANSCYDDAHKENYLSYQTVLDDLWFRQTALRLTNRLGTGRVLDIGCGNGLLLSKFKQLGWECCGLDPSPWSGEFAQKHGFELIPSILEECYSKIGKFDLVVSSSTLEHIAEPIAHVRAIKKVLKERGTAYFCGIPNYGSVSIRLHATNFYCNVPPGHVNYFTVKTLRRLLGASDIDRNRIKIQTYGIPEVHRLYNAVNRFLKPREKSNARVTPQSHRHGGSAGRLSRCAYGAIIAIVYFLGRFAYLGDKLEATFTK